MFRKIYINILRLDNSKDAFLVAGDQGFGNVNLEMNNIYPVNLVLGKKHIYIVALFLSLKYSRMGIYNLIAKDSSPGESENRICPIE